MPPARRKSRLAKRKLRPAKLKYQMAKKKLLSEKWKPVFLMIRPNRVILGTSMAYFSLENCSQAEFSEEIVPKRRQKMEPRNAKPALPCGSAFLTLNSGDLRSAGVGFAPPLFQRILGGLVNHTQNIAQTGDFILLARFVGDPADFIPPAFKPLQ